MTTIHLSLLGAMIATTALWYASSGLPPFVRGNVRANEAVAALLLVMLVRWLLLGSTLTSLAGNGSFDWLARARWVQSMIVMAAHVALGLLVLVCSMVWWSQMSDEHRALNWLLVLVSHGIPVTVSAYASWLCLRRETIASISIAQVAALTPLMLLALLGSGLLARRAHEVRTATPTERDVVSAPASPAPPAPGAQSEPALAPLPSIDAARVHELGRQALDFYLSRTTYDTHEIERPIGARSRLPEADRLQLIRAGDVLRSLLELPGGSAISDRSDQRIGARVAQVLSADAGPSWSFCEELADVAREHDPVKAMFLYQLAIAGYQRDQGYATGAGEAAACTESLRRVYDKVSAANRWR